jgi:hypothetical protein
MDSYVSSSHNSRAAGLILCKYLLAIAWIFRPYRMFYTIYKRASKISISVLRMKRQNKQARTVPLKLLCLISRKSYWCWTKKNHFCRPLCHFVVQEWCDADGKLMTWTHSPAATDTGKSRHSTELCRPVPISGGQCRWRIISTYSS